MLKIFHTGDVHLDSPFSGLSFKESDKRRKHLHSVFAEMMRYAKENDVDAVLIAGDLFDTGFVEKETIDLLCEAFASLDCPVVISPGNHDPYSPQSAYASAKFPSNVYIFSGESLSYFDFDELKLRVFGYAFTSDRLETSPLICGAVKKEGYANLLCAHADISSPLSKYAPVTLRDLERAGFSYAALGHIHKESDAQKIGDCTFAYCGMPVGRSFDELGFGGAKLITLDGDDVFSVENLRFSDSRYVIENLDVSGAEKNEDIIAKVNSLIADNGYGKETSLRVILSGAISPSLRLNADAIEAGVNATAVIQIKNDTTPTLDAASLENDLSIKGEFYRLLSEKMKNGDERERRVAAEALYLGLCALDGKNPV